MLLNHGLYTPSDEKSFEDKAVEKKSFIPKSLSAIDMIKLGKLIRDKERSSAKFLIEKFNMENNEWSISKEVIFETENKAFAEGNFPMAYKAKRDDESFRGNTWVVKKYSVSSKETFEKMGETCESKSRKAVQMNWLARYLSVSFSKAVLKVCKDFGECFNYNPVYSGEKNHECVTERSFYQEISRSILTTTVAYA